MKKPWLIITLTGLLAVSALVLTNYIAKELNDYRYKKESIAEVLNFKERVMTSAEWIPFNDKASSKIAAYDRLQHSADRLYNAAIYYGLFLVGFILIYNLAIAYFYWKKTEFNQMFGISLIFSSLCLIYVALQAPFLEIEAFNTNLAFKVPVDLGFWEKTFEKTFDGKISYFYQNKSVFQLIKLLFTGGNVFVGIALLLFSVIFPLFKLCASLFVLIWPKNQYSKSFRTFILLIGKWSMADVFVAGIFLAYFSFSNMNVGVETNAETLIGLYFFLAFVILSISSSYFVKRAE
ncbi:MAG: paraquat-inducible protein A [Crocinitomicaceae bacterium]